MSERAATAVWPGLRPRDHTRAQELLGPGDVRLEYFLYGSVSMLVIILLEGVRDLRR